MAEDDWQDYNPVGGEAGWKDYEAPITAKGAGRALEEGTRQGISSAAGLPRLLTDTVGRGLERGLQAAHNWVHEKTGIGVRHDTPIPDAPDTTLPTSEEIRQRMENKFGPVGEQPGQYEPANALERGLLRVGREIPNAALGPGRLAPAVARVALPAAGAHLGGETMGPVGEAAGGAVGGVLSGRVGVNRSTPPAGALDELKAAAQQKGYQPTTNAALNQPVTSTTTQTTNALGQPLIRPVTVQGQNASTHQLMTNTLNARGFENLPGSANDVHAAIEPIRNADNMNKFLIARRNLMRVQGEQQPAAILARRMVETELERRIPGSIGLLQEADQNWNRMRTTQDFEALRGNREARAAATYSGTNMGNLMRQMATDLLKPGNKRYVFLTPEDKRALTSLAHGTVTQNVIRWTANSLGGGAGIGNLLAIGGGSTIGAMHGGGEEGAGLGVAMPLVALALKRTYNRSVANQARRVAQTMVAQAPEARLRGYQRPVVPPSAIRTGAPAGYLQSNREEQ